MNTPNPLWAVKREVRLLMAITADTTALNVISWGHLREFMFSQPMGKILHSVGKQLFFQRAGAVVSP